VPLDLTMLPDELAVCRLPTGSAMPDRTVSGELTSMSWTAEETSVVCSTADAPAGVQADTGWRAFVVAGPFAFTLTGILVAIAVPLAQAGFGIFAVSTYETDYVLVKDSALAEAAAALRAVGHSVDLPV
jgi:uncharacterized protein